MVKVGLTQVRYWSRSQRFRRFAVDASSLHFGARRTKSWRRRWYHLFLHYHLSVVFYQRNWLYRTDRCTQHRRRRRHASCRETPWVLLDDHLRPLRFITLLHWYSLCEFRPTVTLYGLHRLMTLCDDDDNDDELTEQHIAHLSSVAVTTNWR